MADLGAQCADFLEQHPSVDIPPAAADADANEVTRV